MKSTENYVLTENQLAQVDGACVWHDIENWFNQAGRDIKQGFDDAGRAIKYVFDDAGRQIQNYFDNL